MHAPLFITTSELKAGDEFATYTITPQDIINSTSNSASLKMHGIGGAYLGWEGFSDRWDMEHKHLIAELLNIFTDETEESLNRSAAAYYLAEMRAPEAANALATNITLHFELYLPAHGLNGVEGLQMKWGGYVAMQALVKIGNPSISSVIRHLADSDDAKVRELSLQVITRIDGAKDIVQVRLQKALKAEKDLQKQARLQAALKSLLESK